MDFEEFYKIVDEDLKEGEEAVDVNPPAKVEEYSVPEGVEPVAMTYDRCQQIMESLEDQGFLEGVDFLVDSDGKFMMTEKMRSLKGQLVQDGVKVGDLW